MENVNGKPKCFVPLLEEFNEKSLTAKEPVQETRQCFKHGEYTADVVYLEDGTQWFVSECPICAEEERREELKREEEWKRKKIIRECEESRIEPEYYFKTLADYIPKTESQRKAKEAVEKMISERHGKIVLLGSNGVGKTMLASITAKELGGKIYSMYEISTMIRQSYTAKAEKTELEIVTELAELPFLAIDEMGRTKGSESEQNWLSFILDKRHTRKLPFMLMSNGHLKSSCKMGGCPKCFENYIGNNILSRLQQDSKIIVISAPDERINIG